VSHRTSKNRKPRKSTPPPVAIGGEVVEEVGLPNRWVEYPNLYGGFHAFAPSKDGPFALCLCASSGVGNLIRLLQIQKESHRDPYLKFDPSLDWNKLLPPAFHIEERARVPELGSLRWVARSCHRCNMLPAARRWSHEMYADQFKQYYGWYVIQAQMRLGLTFYDLFLPDVTPPDLLRLRSEALHARDLMSQEESRLMAMVNGPPRLDIRADEVTYWQNVKMGEEAEFVRLRRAASQAKARFDNAIESIVREEFGHRRVGERWVAETQLFQIISSILPNEKIERHLRPQWLDGLELDIWLPTLHAGVEYQGQQHFKSVDAWGGNAALKMVQERDERKRKLCAANNIILVEMDYTEPLTVEHVTTRLRAVLDLAAGIRHSHPQDH